jgi:hypothetical protein
MMKRQTARWTTSPTTLTRPKCTKDSPNSGGKRTEFTQSSAVRLAMKRTKEIKNILHQVKQMHLLLTESIATNR